MTHSNYLTEIALDEVASLKSTISAELQIPTESFNRLGQSGFWLAIGAVSEDIDFEKHLVSFYELLDSAPHVPADCMLHICIAYTSILLALANDIDKDTPKDAVYVLMAASEFKVMATISFKNRGCEEAKVELAKQKAMRSESGRLGGKARGEKIAPVREWVREMRNQTRWSKRSDAEISRGIFREIPSHLSSYSDDPLRLIYRILRQDSNSKHTV